MDREKSAVNSKNDYCEGYQVPIVELITVKVEQGFAASTDGTGSDMPWG